MLNYANLISSNAPPDQIVSKIAELKNGLDESERFVSGIGVVAPAIAFSSSFSIIFREGLEAALIITRCHFDILGGIAK